MAARTARRGASRSGSQRNTTRRDRHRLIIKTGRAPSPFGPKPPCYHCGDPIDYDADHLDPLAFEIDHLIPLDKDGLDVIENIVPSHRKCNRDKSNKLGYQPGVTFVTQRRWWSS